MVKKVLVSVLLALGLYFSPVLAGNNVFSCRVEFGRYSYQSCYVESPIFSVGNVFSLNLGFDLTRLPPQEILATPYLSLYLGFGPQWLYADLGPTLAFSNNSSGNWGGLSYKLRLIYGFYW
jgi:hypothetical protein